MDVFSVAMTKLRKPKASLPMDNLSYFYDVIEKVKKLTFLDLSRM